MSLAQYHKKRNFRRTAEPKGSVKRAARSGHSFVIQKHDASHLHYDFRLELDGALKSWAVPKGPSLDPSQKRLAVEVEDHPLEYGSFEGTIPEGQYGGGTVMLWDRGTWEPEGDPKSGYRSGRLKFTLHGKKLRGKWMLVRRNAQRASKPQWLLFKLQDDEATPERKYDVTEAEPLSVATGRDLDQIATGHSRVWQSNGKKTAAATPAKVAKARPASKKKRASEPKIPRQIDVQLPTLVAIAPAGDDWLHEIKFDGYRLLCRIDGSDVRFETRNELDWTHKLPKLVETAAKLKLRQTVIDGEVISLDDQGISDFQLLQNAFRDQRANELVYAAFDLLFLKGEDLRDLPLEERKHKLSELIPADRGAIRYTEHLIGKGPEFLEQACQQGLEGIVSKRRDALYVGGRSTDWLKIKCQQNAEFVIGGFTEPTGSRHGFGALLLGYFDKKDLIYAGRVGTGFNDQMLSSLSTKLTSLEQAKSPFANYPAHAERLKGVHWVRPQCVAQIRFSNWTDDRRLRHPTFQGLREDKPAHSVKREIPKMVKVKKSSAQHSSSNGKLSMETEIAGVRVTHPDKILFPEEQITKRDLAEYYVEVADSMLPYVVNRPLTIVRCPDGVDGEWFFQKHPGRMAPDELDRVKIREKRGMDEYLLVKNVQGLVALAQISALEIHVWGSHADAVDKPDQIVFDLDPAPELAWSRVVDAALEVREFLQDLGLTSFVKTTGGKGLHLVCPICRTQEWPFVDDFCHHVALAIERAAPGRYTSVMSKRSRVGKIFVDYLRNQRGSTAITPFSTRAKPNATIAMPVAWQELRKLHGADQFTLKNGVRKLHTRKQDPWAEFHDIKQSLTAAMLKQLS
jgi:bifunctional non-homologous end joining protein LigD